MRKLMIGAALALSLIGAARSETAYRLARVTPLPGAAPSWDYLTLEPGRGLLYIGRRAAGVTVYDTRSHRVVGEIEGAKGANAALPLPRLGRGYTTNGDGTSTVFDLKTFKRIKTIKLGESADAGFYDEATGQIVFTLGDSKELVFVDAASGDIRGRLAMPAEELEGVAADGAGQLFAVERDLAKVARIDARSRKVSGGWDLPGCELPTGVALDRAHGRLFLGCKGEKPVLTVLDTASGRIVAQLPIGRGNDGVVYDAARREVFTSNGVDGNIVVYAQDSPDRYRLDQAVTTRPIARTMALDPGSGRIFTATAEGRVDPRLKINTRAGAFYPNAYWDDTFVLLEYAPTEVKNAKTGDDE